MLFICNLREVSEINKNTVIVGVVFLAIGIFLIIIGHFGYEYLLNEELKSLYLISYSSEKELLFNIRTGGIGLGILGCIISVFGLVESEKNGKPKEEKMEKEKTESSPNLDRRCPNCGRVIPEDAKFCPYCSKKFIRDDSENKEITFSIEILKRRYAKGEITKTEFDEMKKNLEG